MQPSIPPSATAREVTTINSDIQALVRTIDELKSDTLIGCPATYNRLLAIEEVLVDIVLRTTDGTARTPDRPSSRVDDDQ